MSAANTSSGHPEPTVAELAQRLQRVEDELAIRRLIASYGPRVDAGNADAVAAMWTEDGSYDVEGWDMASRADVHAMVNSDQHQGLVKRGCTHFLGPIVLDIDGDTATAVCESLLVVRHKERYVIARAGVSRFELIRADAGWQIQRRVARTLDGGEEGLNLLALPGD